MTHEVTGPITLLPGTSGVAHFPADGQPLSLGIAGGWGILILPLLAFVLTSRPWRPLIRRRAVSSGA